MPVPNFTLPIIFLSKSSLAFWFPPPKKVSGAFPIKSFFLLAILISSLPSLKDTSKGFSESTSFRFNNGFLAIN